MSTLPRVGLDVLAAFTRGAVDVISHDDLAARLAEGRPLRVKAGFDPTRPDLHLGHVVLMSKLRQLQDLGHHVIFIVGDFTAQVGDPTGKNKARPPLTREEVLEGAATYAEQALKVLDRERLEIRYNSEWLGPLTARDLIMLAAKRTVARTLERRDFKDRYEGGRDIYLHELLYPLLQGYDSVCIDADVELGGTDQLFNLLVGRDLMGAHGQRPQIVLTMPLLEGLDARVVDGAIVGDKMSKSADNYVGVDEPPLVQFTKLMLVNDGVIWRYFTLLSTLPIAEIDALREATEAGQLPPREAQRRFAREIVRRFHGADAADAAEASYDHKRAGGFPDDAPVHEFVAEGADGVWVCKAMALAGLVSSTSEGRRMVQGGGVKLGGERVEDVALQLGPGMHELTVGGKRRKYARVVVR